MKRARTIKVRISGDGAKYSRSSNFNIMSFNILTGHNDLSCKGEHLYILYIIFVHVCACMHACASVCMCVSVLCE